MVSRRIVIAGTGSGVGKTTVTLGLMAALQQKGLRVQGFKCGPDYIDTSYHTAVTGRPSRNLDSWMLPLEAVKAVLKKGSEEADISIIEGVMGFYDGKDPRSDTGSTAEISTLTKSPVVLVVDCSGMARSAAAMVKGYQLLNKNVLIAGVIANKVGSEGHFQLIKAAVEQECGIPVVGYMLREVGIVMPERHLGLVPSIERGDLNGFFEELGELCTKTVDLEKIVELAEGAQDFDVKNSIFTLPKKRKLVKIAVARDAAFNFYYQENLELLEHMGAELVYFSPLKNERVPEDVDGLYIGGGFPEEFSEQLSVQQNSADSIGEAILRGLPTLAECGGFMYLANELVKVDGKSHEMIGIIPGTVVMQQHLAALGYREIQGIGDNFLLQKGEIARGHEFHYSTFHPVGANPKAYEVKGTRGAAQEGYLLDNLVAGYTHLHFASQPKLVDNWIQRCLEVKQHV
ncbi:cobyrinate a,c-diamide synthase [Sutcliffiella rhizosphaerae]|uniref:cobyrinate a,c-diamide synthase n=1 Tax=Sutcliffiella rhizosphaerae TaxID=2880967 RepID=UPI001E5A364A|nr:cobyrinate a,c-diamide synthase [Sutcliffiella rhizosphaerae]